MSAAQLDIVVRDIQTVFGAWTAETTLEQMRQDWDNIFSQHPVENGSRCVTVDAGGVSAMQVSAPGARPDQAILYLHGGGYAFGSPRSHRDIGCLLSEAAQAEVFVLDYRLAPEHVFPAAVEDATAAYQWLLAQGFEPERIVIAGDSAGGGLTMATLLSVRDNGLPRPACAVALSPWVDMTLEAETLVTKATEDPIVQREMLLQLVDMYLGSSDRTQPLASPLHADLTGLPPLLIQVGERETLLDDSRNLARRAREAGADVQLEIEPNQVHVFQIFASRLDQGRAAIERIGEFIRTHVSG